MNSSPLRPSWHQKNRHGVLFFRAGNLPCPHGFSTRIGGVSVQPETKALNLGHSIDDDATVRENLRRFAAAVGFDPGTLVSVRQVHSADILTVDRSFCGYGYDQEADFTADGYVTATPGVTIGIRTADCIPILAAATDSQGQVRVVGAFHAGWRGAVAGIAGEGIRRMVDLGADVHRIFVAMGAGIHDCCFVIDRPVYERFLSAQGQARCDRCLTATPSGWFADLYAMNREILEEAGVLPEHILENQQCTSCHPELYYSHRRSGYARGNMLSAICLPTP